MSALESMLRQPSWKNLEKAGLLITVGGNGAGSTGKLSELFPLENAPPPLHMGCANGDFEVVELLLEGGADVNLKEEPGGFAPLHYAAVRDSTGRVTDMLLRGGADINDNINDLLATPLHLAVVYGTDAAASKIIQSVGCDLSLKDSQGDTPLSKAVYFGRESIVGLLLSLEKCDLNWFNKQGFNVLHVAAMEGNEKVVEMVLNYGSCKLINSLTRDGNSMTPLHLACYKSHAAVASLLLEKGCNFHFQNGNGHTPLGVASIAGNQEVVSVLMEMYETRSEQNAVSDVRRSVGRAGLVDAKPLTEQEERRDKPKKDFPPVFCAGDVVKIRSNREVLTGLQQGMDDRNIAELQGKEGSVLIVDDQGNVELTIQGYDRTWTLNPWAVECIRRSNTASSVTLYQEGQRPRPSLMAAVHKRLEEKSTEQPQWQREVIQAVGTNHLSRIKKMILKNPDAVKQKLRSTTLLHLAARNGAIHIMEELLDHNADVNAQDIRLRTPLHVAAAKERTGSAASLLLERRADPNVQGFDDYERTPLHLAVCHNNYAAAKVLIEHKDCNVNLQDSHGDSPLYCAIDQEKLKLVELIVKSQGCNPRLTNKKKHHYNALHLAAIRRNESVARMLHEVCPKIVGDVDFQGNTALHLAAMHGSKEVAVYLLRKGNCNTDLKNKKGKTAFELAASNGHLEVQKLFPEHENEYHPFAGEWSLVTRQSSSNSLDDQENEVMQDETKSALSYWDLDINYGCPSRANLSSCHTIEEVAKEKERTANAKRKTRLPERNVKQITISGASPNDHGTDKHYESLQQDRKSVSEKENQRFCAHASVSQPDLEKTESKGRHDELLSQETCPHRNSETDLCATCQEAKAKGNHHGKFTKKEEHDSMSILTEKTKHFAGEEEVHPTWDLPHPILACESSGNTFEKEQKGLRTVQMTETVLPTPAMCIKCDKNRASVTFRPCGHKVTCEECSFRAKKCVKCRRSVAEKVSESERRERAMTDPDDIPDRLLCCICLDKQKNIAFQCGHMNTCGECAKRITECPECKAVIKSRLTTYY